jgi:hypothetical protein
MARNARNARSGVGQTDGEHSLGLVGAVAPPDLAKEPREVGLVHGLGVRELGDPARHPVDQRLIRNWRRRRGSEEPRHR